MTTPTQCNRAGFESRYFRPLLPWSNQSSQESLNSRYTQKIICNRQKRDRDTSEIQLWGERGFMSVQRGGWPTYQLCYRASELRTRNKIRNNMGAEDLVRQHNTQHTTHNTRTNDYYHDCNTFERLAPGRWKLTGSGKDSRGDEDARRQTARNKYRRVGGLGEEAQT